MQCCGRNKEGSLPGFLNRVQVTFFSFGIGNEKKLFQDIPKDIALLEMVIRIVV